MSTKFYIKRNDTLSPLITILQDADETPVVLTGTTIRFHMWNTSNGVKVNAIAVADPDQTTNPGKVRYDWNTTDTDTDGTFYGEFEVTADDGIQTFPNKTNMAIIITKDLA